MWDFSLKYGNSFFLDQPWFDQVSILLQYYGHRAKLRVIGKEEILEPLNRKALQLARKVADDTGTLMAGNICNTTVYEPSPAAEKECMDMFKVI